MAKKAKASKKTPKRSRGKIPKKAKTPAKKSVKTAGRMKTAQKASLSSSGKAPLTAETGAATQATLKKTPVPVKPGKVTPAKPRGKEPVTMEELLAQTGYELHGVKRGELIEGTVTDISKRMVLVDIGGKTEGLVVDKEYEAAREFIRELAVGDAITVYVLSPENDRGQILLSLKKAASDRTWEKFEEAEKTGEIMTVRGLEVTQGGVIVQGYPQAPFPS